MNQLTNFDISNKLRSLRDIKDPCDRIMALMTFEPEYKQSNFYKITKRPLRELYYEIAIEDILTFRSMLQNFKEFLDELDADKLIALFDEVNMASLQTMKTSLDSLEDSGLADLLHGIKH